MTNYKSGHDNKVGKTWVGLIHKGNDHNDPNHTNRQHGPILP